MEYNLLKQIVPNRSYLPYSFNFRQSSTPGFDCVIPGIGNVASPFTFFVPSYNPLHAHLKKKVTVQVTTVDQEGKGSDERESEDSKLPEQAQQSESSLKKEILDELNKNKRKLLDEAIYESLVHPKKIKTETVLLRPEQNLTRFTKITKPVAQNHVKTNTMNHKFKFE